MRKILDPKNLPYIGALVQAVLFSIAGSQFFPLAGWLVGLGVGAVVNWSLALASSRVSDVSEKRKPLARLSMVSMFLLSPVTITLSLFFPKIIFTAIAWSICVDLSIILAGSIVGKSLIPADKPLKYRSAKPSKNKIRSANIPCAHTGAGCARKFITQNSANAHAGKCKFNPSKVFVEMVNKK
jgi:hypothetical protein